MKVYLPVQLLIPDAIGATAADICRPTCTAVRILMVSGYQTMDSSLTAVDKAILVVVTVVLRMSLSLSLEPRGESGQPTNTWRADVI